MPEFVKKLDSLTVKKEWGGTNTVTITAMTLEGKIGGMVQGDGPFGGWHGVPRVVKVSPPEGPHSLWPFSSPPRKIGFTAKGADDQTLSGEVIVYPDPKYSVEFSLRIFEEIAEKANDAIEAWLKRVFANTPVIVSLKLEGPKGKCDFSWGWEEHEIPSVAYFVVAGDVGIKPLFGVEFETKLSAAAIAGTYIGLPPVIGKFAGKHLADIYLGFRIQFSASFMFGGKLRFFNNGKRDVQGEAPDLVVDGAFEVFMSARAGSDYFVSAEVEGKASVQPKGKANLSVDLTGLYFQPSISLPKIVLAAKFTFRYFYFGERDKATEWVVFAHPEPIWTGSRYRLLPLRVG